MIPLINIEMYKFKKAGIYKYILMLSILPLLFFVYILQGKLELIESGYSINQWCAVLLFQLSEQFLIPSILLIIVYDLVLKEKDIGYSNMLAVRQNQLKALIAKVIPTVIYSLMIVLITIGIIALSYIIAAPHTSDFIGKIINTKTNNEFLAFQINMLFLITYGIFLPLIAVILSIHLSTKTTISFIVTGLLIGRLFSKIGIINEYTLWFYLKQAKYIISINSLNIIWKPYIVMLILSIISLLYSIGGTNKFKLKEDENNE